MWRGREKKEGFMEPFHWKNAVSFTNNNTSTHVIPFQEPALRREWNKRAGAQPDLPSLSGKISTWWQVCNAPTDLAITQSTGCLLLSTWAAKKLPLWMTIQQGELGRGLERLNCPLYSQPIQQHPATPGRAGHPCHREWNFFSSHGSACTRISNKSISGHLPASVGDVWGALLGVPLWCSLQVSPEPSALTTFPFFCSCPP